MSFESFGGYENTETKSDSQASREIFDLEGYGLELRNRNEKKKEKVK